MSSAEKFRPTRFPLVSLLLLIGMIGAGIVAPHFVTGWRGGVFQVVAGDTLLPKIQLWLTLIIAQAALWVASSFYLVATLGRLIRTMASPSQYIRAGFVSLLPAGLVLLVFVLKQQVHRAPVPPDKLGDYSILNLPAFAGVGAAVAGLAVWGMYVICSVWQGESNTLLMEAGKITRYVELRESVLRFLFVAGVIMALGTVASAALRNAVNAERGPNYFAQEYVIIYGALYSILLLAAYVPVYATFFITGAKLRESLCGEQPVSAADFKPWKETRDAINETLGLTLSGAAALGPLVSALLPLFSGWATSLIEAKK